MINQSILSIERSISTQVDNTPVAASGFYPLSNPSGFITGIENLVYTTGDQTISGRKLFSDGLDAGLQVGISTLYIGSGVVGVNNEDPQAAFDVSGSARFSERPFVNGTGVVLIGEINTSNFYTNDNPSGFIAGIENLVYTTGDQTISGVKIFEQGLQVGLDLDVSTLYVLSGAVGINNENPQASLDISGSTLFSERPTVNGTGVLLSGDINTLNFYTNNNPSGFITGVFQPNPDYVSIPDLSAKADAPIGPLDRVSSILYCDASFPIEDPSYALVYGHSPYDGQAFKWNYIYRNNDGLYVQLGNAIVTGGEYPWNVSYNNGVVVTKEAAARLISTLSGSASEGSSIYAARADHIHIFPTASEVGAYSINNPSGFITGIGNLVYTTGDQNISGVKTFTNNVTILGNFAVSGTTYINEVIDVTTTGTISGVTGVFQHLEADNIVYSQTSSYVVAQPGDDLAAKYLAAKALRPNGLAKSATNRASLIIFPGNYTLSAELAIDEEFVDLIGLGAQTQKPAILIGGNTLNVYADDVHVSGISVGSQPFRTGSDSVGQFTLVSKPLQIFENCSGGDNSFGYSVSNEVFAGGTFVNCTAGGGSFGFSTNFYGRATGRFTNCVGGPNCFGGEWGEASGTFVNCIGDFGSFGSYPQEGGAIGTVSGTLTNCRLISGTFQVLSAPATGKATMINCIDGNGDIINGEVLAE